MFAMIREGTADRDKMAQGRAQVEEFHRLRAQQPGYRGGVSVDTGDGKTLIVSLWDTPEQAEAAGEKMKPEADRLLGSLWTTPTRVIARGPVLYNDISAG